MDSSPEVERFQISDADWRHAMDPTYRGRRQKKKHAIYGVWASDSESDEESTRSGLGGGAGKRHRGGGNYMNPVHFISGGIKKSSQKPTNDDDDECEIDLVENDKTDNGEVDPLVAATRPAPPPPPKRVRERFQPHSGFGSEFGNWERHTRGIGMKLLEKMGYEHGKGLGKEGQGIVTPVQAVQRKGKGTLSFYGTEKAPAPVKANQMENETKKQNQSSIRYKKSGQNQRQNASGPEYVVRSAADIIAEGEKVKRPFLEDSEMSKVKVIDMTGREQRVYTGYHALARAPDRPDEDDLPERPSERLDTSGGKAHFEVPVLSHNLRLLVEQAENGIIRADRRMKYEKDRQVNLRFEINRLEKLTTAEELETVRLQKVRALITNFEEGLKAKTLDLAGCATLIREARDTAPELTQLVVALANPMLSQQLSEWQPLEDPSFSLESLREWRELLNDESLFQALLENSWLPRIRVAALSWNPRDVDSMIKLIETWRPFLSQRLLRTMILDQLILPRIHKAVDEWNPLTDNVPIHKWLHPWLPLLHEQLGPIHDMVRQKLGACLSRWHPSDASALAILLPWKDVFDLTNRITFLRQHIQPKLSLVLDQFQINPANQNMDPWKWVVKWADIFPAAMMAAMFEEHFFPKWLDVLAHWLNNRPNLVEVANWFEGWKKEIPGEVASYPCVHDSLQRALQMLERALTGQTVPISSNQVPPPPPPPIPSFGAAPVHHPPPPRLPAPSQGLLPTPVSNNSTTTIRELIERRAEERGCLFVPMPNRFYQGKQVYRLGNVQIYVDRNVVFHWQGTLWQPISIDELMRIAL